MRLTGMRTGLDNITGVPAQHATEMRGGWGCGGHGDWIMNALVARPGHPEYSEGDSTVRTSCLYKPSCSTGFAEQSSRRCNGWTTADEGLSRAVRLPLGSPSNFAGGVSEPNFSA